MKLTRRDPENDGTGEQYFDAEGEDSGQLTLVLSEARWKQLDEPWQVEVKVKPL